jgi:hypothetical protein
MARVTPSRHILHTFNIDSKGLGWGGLILAAESEIERIEQRAVQLREAIVLFTKKEQAGEPFVVDVKDTAARNDVTPLQQHTISPLPEPSFSAISELPRRKHIGACGQCANAGSLSQVTSG